MIKLIFDYYQGSSKFKVRNDIGSGDKLLKRFEKKNSIKMEEYVNMYTKIRNLQKQQTELLKELKSLFDKETKEDFPELFL